MRKIKPTANMISKRALIIERKKYDSLMERSTTYGTIPVYINSTPKGVWGFYLQQYHQYQ